MRGRRCRGGGAVAVGAAGPPPRRRRPLCRLGHPSRGGRRGGRARGAARPPDWRAAPEPPRPAAAAATAVAAASTGVSQRAVAAGTAASLPRCRGVGGRARPPRRWLAGGRRHRRPRRGAVGPPPPAAPLALPSPPLPTAWRPAGVGARLPLPPASGGRRTRRRGSPVDAARVRAWRRRPVAAAPVMAAAAASAPPPPHVAAAAGTRRPPRRPMRQGHPGREHPAPSPAPRRRAWAHGRCGSSAPPPPRTRGRAADGGPVGARWRGGRRRRVPRRRGGCEAYIGRHARSNSWRRSGGGSTPPAVAPLVLAVLARGLCDGDGARAIVRGSHGGRPVVWVRKGWKQDKYSLLVWRDSGVGVGSLVSEPRCPLVRGNNQKMLVPLSFIFRRVKTVL